MIPTASVTVAANTTEALVVEAWLPFDARPGTTHGTVTVGLTVVPIQLTVRPFALPRQAVFSNEMNGYGLPDSVAQYTALQREAYLRRCHVNLLPYSHRTAAADSRHCVMDLRLADGRRMDEARYNAIQPGANASGWWEDFSTAFGPHLDGSAWRNEPRGAIPAPGFYLTFHESWPLPLRPWWNGNLDASAAFDRPEYAATFQAVLRDFCTQARQRGWGSRGPTRLSQQQRRSR